MSNKKPIQLSIPNPCHEDWEQMTPCAQGRFCASCQKTVIDFTSWSDSALYEFFSKNTAPVCGQLARTQLNREIQIPHQPMSRLYRIAIACGLTLMFAQVPDVHAMVKQPIEQLSATGNNENTEDTSKADPGIIRGIATDETNEPIIGAIIEVYSGGIKKSGAATDIDGIYEIKNLPKGVYDILGRSQGYKAVKITGVAISDKVGTSVNLNFNPNQLEEVQIVRHSVGLINDRSGINPTYARGDIQKVPTRDLTKLISTQSKLQTDDNKHIVPDIPHYEQKIIDRDKRVHLDEERATRNVYKQDKK